MTTDLANWFDNLDDVLQRQAEQAGLFDHGTITGNVREFLVHQVLASFLPPAVHIGTGRLIDRHGTMSRQVDIVASDSLFPRFSASNIASLYPIEGVVAAVEVKSSLDKASLASALENCWSIHTLKTEGALTERSESLRARRVAEGISPEDALIEQLNRPLPATYIFSFRGPSNPATLAESIQEWIDEKAASCALKEVYLPRMIVAGKIVAVKNDGFFRMSYTERSDNKKILYVCADLSKPFGIFACHVITAVCSRLGSGDSRWLQTEISDYLPVAKYICELSNSRSIRWVELNK